MSTYYIKSKFGNLKEIDGVSLQEGVNAFSSLTQISDLLQEGDCVVLLDVKPAVSSADIPAGINVFSGNYVDYWDDNISCKPSGSLSLTLDNMGSETTNSFCNFKDLEMTNSTVKEIIGGEFINSDQEKANCTGKWIDEAKASGNATITDSYVSSVSGYNNVSIKNSYVEDLSASYFGWSYKNSEHSTLIIDSNKASGTISCSEKWTSADSVTVSGPSAVVLNISYYKNIVLDEEAYSSWICAQEGGSELKQTIKTTKSGVSAVEENSFFYESTGALTVKNNAFVSDVSGIKTIKITNSSVGEIYGGDYNDSTKITCSFSDVDALLEHASGNTFYFDKKIWLSSEEQMCNKASGSISIKLDKNAEKNISVGSIYYYASVDISGCQEYSVSVGEIVSECMTIKESRNTIKGTYSKHQEYSAYGSISLSDNVSAGNISNFANVTLKNATAGAITAYDCSNVDGIDAGYYKCVESQSADGSYKREEEGKAIGSISLDYARVASVTNYAKVTLKNNSIVDGNIYCADTYNYKTKVSYVASKDKYYESCKVSYTNTITAENSFIAGDVDNFSTVKLINTSVGGVLSGCLDENYNFIGTFSFTVNFKNAKSEVYSIGGGDYSIYDFKNVTVSGIADLKKGNFVRVDVNGEIYGANKLTLKNNVWVKGNITDCKIINISNCQIDGSFEYFSVDEIDAKVAITVSDTDINGSILYYNTVKYTKGNISGDIYANSVTLSDVDVAGEVYAKKLTIAKGNCKIGFYPGDDCKETLTINKDAVLEVDGLYFGEGKDKLVVNGTLLLTSAVDFNQIELESFSGSGIIAAERTVCEEIVLPQKSKVKLVNLGNTSEGFAGKKAENSDNTAKKAAVADWEYDEEGNLYIDGWLSKGTEIEDTCDWIKFTAQNDAEISFYGLGEIDTLSVNGKKVDDFCFDVYAGAEYKICITRNESDSVYYYASMQLA